jgi:UDP-N-acetylglucosamine 1-carboxyvinyltransferase
MKVIIVGGGQVGTYLASLLIGLKHDVKVIEEREGRLPAMRRDLPEEAIVLGNGTDVKVLESVGIASADVVAAVTGGEIEVHGTRHRDMEGIASALQRMQVCCSLDEHTFRVAPSTPVGATRITTGLWPAFPSDLISLIAVLATQASGRTLLHDWMYELRLFALEQMSGMGADLFLCDPHRIIVSGPKRLRGRRLDTRDLRSGMSLAAAALAADGQSLLGPLETVERGYANLLENLQALGAKVEKVA